jgi:hypothetical protein
MPGHCHVDRPLCLTDKESAILSPVFARKSFVRLRDGSVYFFDDYPRRVAGQTKIDTVKRDE